MNSVAKEKANAKSTETLPSVSQSSELSNGLRRSSREKHAPITLVVSGGSSKTYWSSTAVSMSRSAQRAKVFAMKTQPSRATELKKVLDPTTNAMIPYNMDTQVHDGRNTLSQESSECDSALSLPSAHIPSTMVTRLKGTALSSTLAGTVRPKRNKGEIDLDEPTMIAFKEFLQRHKFDSLNESELIEDTLSIVKAANERSKSFISELNGDRVDIDDDLVFEKCLQVEENYVIGHDLLKEIVTGISQATSGSSKSKKSSGNNGDADTRSKVAVDQKTVAWIRRATGIHRNASIYEMIEKNFIIQQQETKSSASSRVGKRQHANGRNAKPAKRNRGLDVMIDAIVELENDFGSNFPLYRFPISSPNRRKSFHSHDGSTKKQKRKDIINGKTKENSGKKNCEGSKINSRKKKRLRKVKIPSPRICTALGALDHAWRFQTKPNSFVRGETETDREYHARKLIPLHPQFVTSGIIHRLPTMNSLFQNTVIPVLSDSISHLPASSDNDKLQKVFKGLEGPPARFAKCEFFYSDIDREWYMENVVASLLGVSLDTPLLPSEWKMIRRRCKLCPRRFSKQFIASELIKRNEYRNTVRLLQRKPHMLPTKFPYHIYKPLGPGTMVRAYCKIQQCLQRGVVASYDPTKAMYIVEFEDESCEYEYCPDSDVASCETPSLLISKNDPYSRDGIYISVSQLQAVDFRLRSVATIEKIEMMLDKCVVGFATLLATSNKLLSDTTKNLLEDVANNDAFLTLTEVIDAAVIRKRNILSSIADTNTLSVDFLPFGEEDKSSEQYVPLFDKTTHDHLQWLHSNLERTNDILGIATDFFQTLYGSSLLSTAVVMPKETGDLRSTSVLNRS